MITIPTLTGLMVRLVGMTPEHAPGLLAAAEHGRDNYRYTHVPADLPTMHEYVAAALAEQAAGTAVPLVVVTVETGEILGTSRFMDLRYWPDTPCDVPSVAEIGSTWLSASAQGTGINREIKVLMLGYAFDTWGIHRVTLKTDARNARSRRAIEKLGATFEGIRRAHVPASDGGIRNSAYYSILRAEWPSLHERLRSAS